MGNTKPRSAGPRRTIFEQRAAAPLALALDTTTEVAFDEADSIAPYMPAFAVEIAGTKVAARFDSGGIHLLAHDSL